MNKQTKVLTLIAALGLSGAAYAAPTYDMWVSTGAPVLGLTGSGVDPCFQSTTSPVGVGCSTASSAVDNNYGLVIGASASASATPGALHLGATASVSPLGGDYARAHGYLYEPLTFTIPGAVTGSSGQLSGAFVINGSLGTTATGSPLATNVGLASLNMQGSFGGVNIGTSGNNLFSTASGQIWNIVPNAVIPITWNFTVGPNGQVLGSFTVMADVNAEANASQYRESSSSPLIDGYASASANFSNTIAWGGISELKIDGQVVTNYTVTSDSGFDYIHGYAPVPIPAAVWLFGSGLLGLIGVARRKARAA